MPSNIAAIQETLAVDHVDGWPLYDSHGSNGPSEQTPRPIRPNELLLLDLWGVTGPCQQVLARMATNASK